MHHHLRTVAALNGAHNTQCGATSMAAYNTFKISLDAIDSRCTDFEASHLLLRSYHPGAETISLPIVHKKSTRIVCRPQHRYVPVPATPFSRLALSGCLADTIGSAAVLWQMHKMRCFLTHPRQMFWQIPCVSHNKL